MTPSTEASRPWLRAYIGLVIFSLLGMALQRVSGLKPGWIAPIAGALTLLTGVAVVVAPVGRALGPKRAVTAVGAVLGLGTISEIIGLYTGLPFGAYVYTDRWWPSVPLPGEHRFPLLLPAAWLMVAGAAYLTSSRHFPRAPISWVAVISGLLAALVDLPMEPVMTGTLGYWRWTPPGPLLGAPVMNFVGWWLTGSLAAWLFEANGARDAAPDPGPARALLIHVVFVLLTGLIAVPIAA